MAILQINQRSGSASSWTTSDPILQLGEIGYETDTGLFKIGDNVTAWTSLGYWGDFVDVRASGDMIVTSAGPRLKFVETGVTANNTKWDFIADAEQMQFRVLADDEVTHVDWLTVDRTLNAIDLIDLRGTTVRATGALDVTGNITVAGTVDGIDIAARDHDSVTLAGTPNYITISGQVITRAQVNLASHVTGDLPFANIAQIATNSILGRTTAATGDIEVLTPTQVTAMLDTFTTSLKGLAPSSGGGTTNFLRADGTWNVPPGTGLPLSGGTLTGSLVMGTGTYLQLRTATTTQLNSITDAVNTDAGKEQGAVVYNSTTDNPVYATGNTDGAVWVDGAGTTVHTPV